MVFKWSVNLDEDYLKYRLYSANNESMSNKSFLFESLHRGDTTTTQVKTGLATYYQVHVINLEGDTSK